MEGKEVSSSIRLPRLSMASVFVTYIPPPVLHPSQITFEQNLPTTMAASKILNESAAWKVLLGSIVSVVLATTAVGLRLVARRLSDAPYWWDDYTICGALVRDLELGPGKCT